ncbi:MAG TPA: hypothetical protein VGM29_05520 [Polyangiaceae bacterium]|jgi:hypothetical protein
MPRRPLSCLVALLLPLSLAACSSDNQANAPSDPGAGGILFAVSGEALALGGYAFPPLNPGDPAFVDGWQLTFSHLLVTIDHLTLSSNPDISAGDQSLTGAVVAGVDGPWALDLSHSDPSYLPGKGGPDEEAVPIASLAAQNRNGNAPFATDGTRYAFGFDTVAATPNALNINLDASALSAYQGMIQSGCIVDYVGTATFRGGTVEGHTDCNDDPEYANWPKTVNFELCFKSPTSYRNCQNPDNASATPLGNDEFQRGVAPLAEKSVIAQVTVHTDHPFWDSVLHDSPAHFDQFAARVSDQTGTPTVTLEMTRGVDYTAVTDAVGNPLNWRYCIDPPTDVHGQFNGPMAFDPGSVPHAPDNQPAHGLRDYYDFSTYDQSTQGHLNSDGLCYVSRNYPSPN